MKKILLDLIDECFLREFEKKVAEKDECGCAERLRKMEEEPFAELNEEQIQKVKHIEWELDSKLDNIHFESQKYLLNYAFHLGMEMQKAFDKEDFE